MIESLFILQWLINMSQRNMWRKLLVKTILFQHLVYGNNFEDIDFEKLPNQFVLKCTHDSGGLVICKDKSKLDIGAARKKINTALKRNFYYVGREWPYKNVKPRIIAENYMVDGIEDENSIGLIDYKIFLLQWRT